MSHYAKLLVAYVLAAVFSVSLVLTQFPIISHADVPASQKVVLHTGTWGFLDWDYSMHSRYFTIQDATGIPTSQLTAPYYFYTNDGVTFDYVSGGDLVMTVLNRGIGIVLDPDKALALIQSFFAAINSPDSTYNIYVEGGLYDSNNNFLGYCLNDISGCYYVNNASNYVDVPSDQVNNVYNYYNYYLEQHPSYPDFINVDPFTTSYYLDHYSTNNEYFAGNVNLYASNNDYLMYGCLAGDSSGYTHFDQAPSLAVNDAHFILKSGNSNLTAWNTFCDNFGLSSDHNHLTVDLILSVGPQSSGITFDTYNSSDGHMNNFPYFYLVNKDNYDLTYQNTQYQNDQYFGATTGNQFYNFIGSETFTIYKDSTAYQSVLNQTYTPSIYTTTTYNNYNVTNDNSFRITKTIVDNSVTTNETIYEDCNNTYYDYVDNSNVDVDEITNNTTIIINNNYPSYVDPDPEGPDNPPSGDDDDTNIDNETILDAILDALARFFRAIGKILATILAGLLEVVDTVLEAIAGIMENFTGITDFLGALFSWLPSPIPEVIGAGVSICILFAIFRFIRG